MTPATVRALITELVSHFGGDVESLAAAAGVSVRVLSPTRRKWSVEETLRLAHASGAPVGDILKRAHHCESATLLEHLYGPAAKRAANPLPPSEALVLRLWRSLKAKDRRLMIAVIDRLAAAGGVGDPALTDAPADVAPAPPDRTGV